MKYEDILGDIERVARLVNEASRQLRDENIGRFWEDDYSGMIEDDLLSGLYWRRVPKIKTVEDARRDLLDIAARRKARAGA